MKLNNKTVHKAIRIAKKHNEWRRGAKGPMQDPKIIGLATDTLIEAAQELIKYREELSKVMPSDYKDWWQNDPAEWPLIARLTIENLAAENERLTDCIDKINTPNKP